MRRILKIIFSNLLTYFILLFFVILIFVSSQPAHDRLENSSPQTGILLFTPTPSMVPRPGVPTPYPPEMLARSAEQTNGIVLMGVLLVLIVIWGTISVINQKNQKKS